MSSIANCQTKEEFRQHLLENCPFFAAIRPIGAQPSDDEDKTLSFEADLNDPGVKHLLGPSNANQNEVANEPQPGLQQRPPSPDPDFLEMSRMNGDVCVLCEEGPFIWIYMEGHLRDKKCCICGKRHDDSFSLREHVLDQKNNYKCCKCDRQFDGYDDWRAHLDELVKNKKNFCRQ